jgi:hypothetical protein
VIARAVALALGGLGACAVALTAPAACGDAFTAGENGDGAADGTTTADGPSSDVSDGPTSDGRSSGDSDNDGGRDAAGGELDVRLPDVFDEVPPSCAGGFACVPVQPIGWQQSNGWNLFEIYDGPFSGIDAGPPQCDPNFALSFDSNGGFDDAGAKCACGCDPPSEPCPPSAAIMHIDSQCNDSPCGSTPLQNGACAVLSDTCNAMSNAVEVPQPTPAGCTPSASVTIPPAFAASTRACVSQYLAGSSDCPAGTMCQPTPGAPFGPKLCIGAAGVQACPPQSYTDQRVLYGGYSDGRGCTPCTCGPSTHTCSSTFTLYGACPNVTSYGQFTTCAAHNPTAVFSIVAVTAANTPATCPPQGGLPSGSVALSAPVTMCCMP